MKNILLIGDIMLDEWVYGDVERISPEAPIPVLDTKKTIKSLGGAGNVFANLIALDCEPFFITGIGDDVDGNTIKKLIKDTGGYGCYYDEIPESYKKTRICCGQQQIVRIDTGKGKSIDTSFVDRIIDELHTAIFHIDTILISDYGKGIITKEVLNAVSDYCLDTGAILLIDPYKNDYYLENNVMPTLIKFNRSEAEHFIGFKITNEGDVITAGVTLRSKFNSKYIVITLGTDGIALFDKHRYPLRIVDSPVHVYDVCGAGDVVFAVLGYMMNKGNDIKTSLNYAARAGKMAVSQKGTSVVNHTNLFRKEN